jgi:hypothetical protein
MKGRVIHRVPANRQPDFLQLRQALAAKAEFAFAVAALKT